MKQTAVDWFLEELENNDWYWLPESIKNEIIDQAKEMEEDQLIDFGKKVADHWGMVPVPLDNIKKFYYESTKE